MEGFAFVRVALGLIWVANAWFQAYHIGRDFLPNALEAAGQGQPPWLQGYIDWFASVLVGPWAVGASVIMALLDAVIAACLLTGWRLRLVASVGFVYVMLMWSTLEGMGGPYLPGATDPGPGIVYALLFCFVFTAEQWRRRRDDDREARIAYFGPARILFGLLWAFDAYWKWHPYFLTHSDAIVAAGQQGQPGWLMAYIGFFVAVIDAVSPVAFGLAVAVVETFLAASLLFGKWLRVAIPLGIVLTLGIWTTAEGFGGPYTVGSTGAPDDLVGTAILYTFGFLYLWIAHRPLYVPASSGSRDEPQERAGVETRSKPGLSDAPGPSAPHRVPLQ